MNLVRLKNRMPTKLNSTMPVSTVKNQLPSRIKLPAAQVSALPLGTLLLGNYDAPADAAHFRPYEARIYLSKAE